MRIKFEALVFIFVLIFSHTVSLYSESGDKKSAVIYFNEACSDCTIYINKVLIKLLEEGGIENIVKKDYINEKGNREELNRFNNRIRLPPELQGHFTIVIDEKIILEGHVPEGVIEDLLKRENQEIFERIVVFQDEMHKNAETYKVWAFKGEIKEYPINTSISEYLNWFKEYKDLLKTPADPVESFWNLKSLLFVVLLSGLLDGINPCAITVLLFFIAFLYTIHRVKKKYYLFAV